MTPMPDARSGPGPTGCSTTSCADRGLLLARLGDVADDLRRIALLLHVAQLVELRLVRHSALALALGRLARPLRLELGIVDGAWARQLLGVDRRRRIGHRRLRDVGRERRLR